MYYCFVKRVIFVSRVICSRKNFCVQGKSCLFPVAAIITEPALWGLKHKELIWLFTKYYTPEELRLFFHPMTDEDVPFKSLVLAHYRKAEYTDVPAEMCGYGLHTFRRIFKKEFGISPYKWLTMKRAEHIRHRLSLPYIPFADIIEEFHFSSAGHFSNFCKQFLGDTPTNLRKMLSAQRRNV